MQSSPRMSSRPPASKGVEDFIAAAEQPAKFDNDTTLPAPPSEEVLPWQAPGVREDVIKSVNLRLHEPLLLKLKYVSEQTRKSQQELIREAMEPFLAAELERIASFRL